MNGAPSLYHDFIEKELDCVSLLSNPTIDAKMGDLKPPGVIPGEIFDAFTYNGQVGISPFDGGILNQRYLGKQVSVHTYTEIRHGARLTPQCRMVLFVPAFMLNWTKI